MKHKTRNATHGLSKRIPEYAAWENMKRRCYYRLHNRFEHYGGKGIIVCEKWKNDFVAFYTDMGSRPSEHHSLDRIDVTGNYEPRNCRWATRIEQARNKTNNVCITVRGVRRCVTEWCSEFGIKANVVRGRIKRGWPLDELLFIRNERYQRRNTK